MARPKGSIDRDIHIYLHVYFLRRTKRRASGEPMALTSCYENVRQKLEELWKSGQVYLIESADGPRLERMGANLGSEGEYGAIRAACDRGRKLAIELAASFGLSASLTDEERTEKLEQFIVSKMPLSVAGAFLTMTSFYRPMNPKDAPFKEFLRRVEQEGLSEKLEHSNESLKTPHS